MKSQLIAIAGSLLPFITYSLNIPQNLEARVDAPSSWAGSNLYFLHGLSDSDQDSYINTLASNGAKVLRIWGLQPVIRAYRARGLISLVVTALSPGCQKGSNIATNIPAFETAIGTYNFDTLAALDKVLNKLVAKQMKAIISPHDGNAVNPSDSR